MLTARRLTAVLVAVPLMLCSSCGGAEQEPGDRGAEQKPDSHVELMPVSDPPPRVPTVTFQGKELEAAQYAWGEGQTPMTKQPPSDDQVTVNTLTQPSAGPLSFLVASDIPPVKAELFLYDQDARQKAPDLGSAEMLNCLAAPSPCQLSYAPDTAQVDYDGPGSRPLTVVLFLEYLAPPGSSPPTYSASWVSVVA